MIIKTLYIKNFRNYESLTLDLNDKLNIIYGQNGQGKTNLLESIYLLGFTNSHRSFTSENLIKSGADKAIVKGKLIKDIPYNLEIDLNSLKKSIRCKKEVCEFIRNNLNIEIYPSEDKSVVVKEIVNQKEIDYVMNNDNIIKLFYQNSKLYKGNVENWGNSKGSTYNNVCVVLNQNTYNLYKENNLKDLKMATRNKLYVACTRTKNNLFFVEERKLIKYKKEVDLCQI